MITMRIIATALSLPEERAGRCPPDSPNIQRSISRSGLVGQDEGRETVMEGTKITMITMIITTKWPSSGLVGQDEGRGAGPVEPKGGKRRCGARERRARGAPAPPRLSLSPASSSARSISVLCCGLSRGGDAGGCFMAIPTASVGGSR